MLHIEWWHDAVYGHMLQLAASGFAWEHLRRNDDYRQDCRTLELAGRQDAERLESFAHRWGLLFSKRSRHAGFGMAETADMPPAPKQKRPPSGGLSA